MAVKPLTSDEVEAFYMAMVLIVGPMKDMHGPRSMAFYRARYTLLHGRVEWDSDPIPEVGVWGGLRNDQPCCIQQYIKWCDSTKESMHDQLEGTPSARSEGSLGTHQSRRR